MLCGARHRLAPVRRSRLTGDGLTKAVGLPSRDGRGVGRPTGRRECVKFAIALHMERKDPGQSMEQVSDQILELLAIADEARFEVAWAIEHHGHEYFIGPNPLMQLVHWAGRTRRIRLGTA